MAQQSKGVFRATRLPEQELLPFVFRCCHECGMLHLVGLHLRLLFVTPFAIRLLRLLLFYHFLIPHREA